MMTMRNSACLLLCVGVGLALENTGCQWISGLDEVRVDSNNDQGRTSSGAGGAGGSHGIGGMGGAPIGSGSTTSGGGNSGLGLCSHLDLPPQPPTLCSESLGEKVTVYFANECDMGEIVEAFWIPYDTGGGSCGPLESYGILDGPGASFSLSSNLGNRWRLVEQKSGRVLKDDLVVTTDGEVFKVP